MILYLIQVVAFQLLFLLTYDLFLKKETFFNWNRAYLICASLISFVLPFIKIESFQKAIPQEYIILLPEIILTPQKAVETMAPSWNWYLIIGITVSSLLFLFKISQLIRLKLKGIIVHKESYKIIKIPNSTLAFSIFNYIFIGEEIQEEKLEDILSHELVHIREKHSLDLLYFELLRILCWFNPLVYIYQKRISEIHEYIADAAIVQDKNKFDYYEKLLAEVFQTQHFSFTNQFFKHSLIKKRISMLTKQKSRQIFKLKYLVLIPVLALSLLYTSCEENKVADTEEKSIDKDQNYDKVELETVAFTRLDKAPVFPGCESETVLEAIKKCFSESIQKHVNRNFNFKVADNLELEGTQKIYAKFVIDRNGNIGEVQVKAPHPDLVLEVERIMTLIPKLEPGMKDGKSVKVSYTLPIMFKIQE